MVYQIACAYSRCLWLMWMTFAGYTLRQFISTVLSMMVCETQGSMLSNFLET